MKKISRFQCNYQNIIWRLQCKWKRIFIEVPMQLAKHALPRLLMKIPEGSNAINEEYLKVLQN
jgi:hypothetical protein